jgi:hypothetical protein
MVTAIFTFMVLTAIAVPDFTVYPLTMAEVESYAQLGETAASYAAITSNPLLIILVFLALSGLVAIMLVRNINPNFSLPVLREIFDGSQASLGQRFVRLLLIGGGLSLALVVLGILLQPLSRNFSGGDAAYGAGWGLLTVLAFGALWAAAGETGLAGNFSYWRPGEAAHDRKPLSSFLLGAATGGIAFAIAWYATTAFGKTFILISEVFDGSGETSFLGFTQIKYAMFFYAACVGVIIPGAAAALAPAELCLNQRVNRSVIPLVFLGILLVTTQAGYRHAIDKYDLGHADLAEAAGLSTEAADPMTLLLFDAEEDGKVLVQPWPVELAVNMSFHPGGSVVVSEQNLTRIDDYLTSRPDGTVYQYAAMDGLYRGHFAFWDPEPGHKYMHEVGYELLIARVTLLSKLKAMPATEQNIRYLRDYTDETIWKIEGEFAGRVAEAYWHMGLTAEGDRWFKKAMDTGADESKFKRPEGPALLDGEITGTLTVNGKVEPGVKVALMKEFAAGDGLTITQSVIYTLAVSEPDADGQFSFGKLGSGRYQLVLVFAGNTLPGDTASSQVSCINPPGVIKLDNGTPRVELGDIEVSFQQQ